MKAAAALAVMAGAASATGLPPWVVFAATILTSSALWQYLSKRRDEKWELRLNEAKAQVQQATAQETQMKTARAMEDLQASILLRAQDEHRSLLEDMGRLRSQLNDANERASQAERRALETDAEMARQKVEWRAALDEKERRMAIMRSELERLHDQMSALKAEQDFGKRRKDDSPAT